MTARVPMSVVGGFLGAGKTTLLNRILSGRHGVRYAVLVNDFGELVVDGDLVAAHGGDTVTFANGCVCCTMGDSLVGALDRLLDGDRCPDQILVEASGVADPSAIAEVATLHPGLARDLVVVLADAGTVRSRHGDERLRDTVVRQLASADLLVLNKCDQVTEGAREAAEAWLRSHVRAPVIRAVAADVPMELLAAARADSSASAGAPAPAGAADHSHRFRSHFVSCENPVDRDRLRTVLRELSPRVLRAKGFVVASGEPPRGRESDRNRAPEPPEPEWMVVQASGRTTELEPWRPPADRTPPPPGIVFIGLDDLPSAEELRAAVQRAAAPSPCSSPASSRPGSRR